MKKSTNIIFALGILFCMALLITSCTQRYKPVLSSTDGVGFSTITLEQAKAQAKRDHRPLFVFTHATWCPTCKKMEQEVLIKKDIGDVFNEKFVTLAIDLDSPEGHKLNQQYPIKATPTLFFFNQDGKLIKKTEGFADERELLEEAQVLLKNQHGN
jgi:thioredoxin 1